MKITGLCLIVAGVLLILAGILLEMFPKKQKLQDETGSGTVTGIKLPKEGSSADLTAEDLTSFSTTEWGLNDAGDGPGPSLEDMWDKIPKDKEALDQIKAFEPVSTLGYGPPSFSCETKVIFPNDGFPFVVTEPLASTVEIILPNEPWRPYTKADAEEIVRVMESLKGYWHTETMISGNDFTITARPDSEEQRAVTALHDKWRKRLEEMK